MNISLSFPPNGTAIPYFNPDECDSSRRHEYVDLRLSPADVDDLPELRAAPELKAFLLAINGPATIFRTFGCNFELSLYEASTTDPAIAPTNDSRTEPPPSVVHSYIHVGFADIDRCRDLDDYYRLCGRLGKHLHEQAMLRSGATEDELEVELALGPLWIDEEDRGYVLTIACDALACTVEHARQLWLQLMSIVSAFLATEKLDVPNAITSRTATAAEHQEAIRVVTRNAYKLWTNRE